MPKITAEDRYLSRRFIFSRERVCGTYYLLASASIIIMVMNPQQAQAVRNLYRTFLRLTQDVERASAFAILNVSAAATVPLSAAVASVLEKHQNDQSKRHTKADILRPSFQTVQDIKQHVRKSFREPIDDGNIDDAIDSSQSKTLPTSPSSTTSVKDKIAQAIQGIRQLEDLLHHLESQKRNATAAVTTDQESTDLWIDDAWVTPLVDRVQWLDTLDSDHDAHLTKQQQQQTMSSNSDGGTNAVELPLFPLSGPFFTPQKPLELFTSHGEFPTPGAEITLKIFEPRYRALYNDLLTRPSNRRFVVPLAHPYRSATFAQYGLLYQITDWQEVADETNGVFQYVCQHVVTYPVRIHSVLNPLAWQTRDTYLRVKATVEMDQVELGVAARQKIMDALDRLLEEKENSSNNNNNNDTLVTKCKDALFLEGVWGLIRCWNAALQQKILQLELQIAAVAKEKLQQQFSKSDPPLEKVKEVIEQVQNDRRQELLRLKLDLALSVPLILQTKTDEERLRVILDLITHSTL